MGCARRTRDDETITDKPPIITSLSTKHRALFIHCLL
jgi:hypothetical protein